MKVIRAGVLGYCMGVRRAVDMALAGRLAGGGSPRVFTIGPLIHNPQVMRSLEERGVAVLDEGALPGDLAGAVVIIRAHGISPGWRPNWASGAPGLWTPPALRLKPAR